MGIEFGNAGQVDTNGTGWFIGFSDWTKTGPAGLRHMPAGQAGGEPKPLSEGRMISILAQSPSEFVIEFCPPPGHAGCGRPAS